MSIELLVQPPFLDDWTAVTISGEHEDEVANILVSRLVSADFEVMVEDESGEMISWEDHDNG